MDALPATFWRRWYVYAAVPGVFAAMGAVLWAVDSVGGGDTLAAFVFFVSMVGLAPLILWSLVGFYYDAKALGETDVNWRPTWWAWALAHLLLTPLLVISLYLVFRTIQTGTPWANGYSIR